MERFGVKWDEHLPQLLFAYRTKPHESTGESPFFLLFGRDARIPCDAVLVLKRSPYRVDIDDCKSELAEGLAEAWETAKANIGRAQRRQKLCYDRRATQRKYATGDRVMVLMPHEQTGKICKLAHPYFGPYRVVEVYPNGVSVRPVDCPSKSAIRVNQDRVTLCSSELPDKSWLGTRNRCPRKR